MSEGRIIHICKNVGVSGTTPVVVEEFDGGFEARVGVALFGGCNMTDEEFEACGHNPFHKNFHDNYASGIAKTKEEALDRMRADLKSIGDSLFS